MKKENNTNTSSFNTFIGCYPTKPLFKGSRPEVFCKKGVLRNIATFTGKHLCQSLLLKKRLWYWCFPVNFANFLKMNSCFFLEVKKHLRWLLLFIDGAIPLRNFEFPKKGVSLLTKYFFSRNFQSFKFFHERMSCVKNGT